MRCTKVKIHLNNLVDNFLQIKKRCPDIMISAAVKANAYGHGAVQVAKTLEENGCDFFGVATIYEAEELLNNGIKVPIILYSLQSISEVKDIVRLGIETVVSSINYIQEIEKESITQGKITNVHLKVDTGMGRIGCTPADALDIALKIKVSKYLNLKGICTHLSTSESENQDYTNRQLSLFKDVLTDLKSENIKPQCIHAANSGGISINPDSIFNMVRPGITLYGYPPAEYLQNVFRLKPVLELETEVVSLKQVPKGSSISYGRTYTTTKQTFIATIPIGYADGYFRLLSNLGKVSINNKIYPIVGNICMDQIMLEVDSTVKLYDKVTLIGTKKGEPNAHTIALKIGTISYEVLTNIHRVKRYYIK
ncbi:MAG: alanine racemase [Spirochaetaceae bacterium]